jgi:hypothetical protein
MSGSVVCAGPNFCHYVGQAQTTPVPGYYCQQSQCYRCPSGYYSTNGVSCSECPYKTTSSAGSGSCVANFNFTNPGIQRLHIPFGVNKISVRMWGGGGGGDKSANANNYPPSSGGGAGFVSCNISVNMNSIIYIVVAGGAQDKSNNYIPNSGGTLLICNLLYLASRIHLKLFLIFCA